MAPSVSVAHYYAGKNVFITGSTGFMGKVLVEKLLRSCPDIGNIYLLLRPKKGQNSKERLDDFINNRVFDRLHSEAPHQLSKLRLVAGDILQAGLAASAEDVAELMRETHVLFHCAACVRFDQSIRDAVRLNTGGTQKILSLAEKMENLEVFVHVSTAYCRCELDTLEERLYGSKHQPRHVMDTVEWMDDELLRHLEPKIIDPQPNTYAYTKSLTEELVSQYEGKFPIAIARPSIVTASFKEPIPGWVDNLNGPTGLLVGAGKGVIRTMHCNADYKADVIPVDLVVNGCILLAATTAIDNNWRCHLVVIATMRGGKVTLHLTVQTPTSNLCRYSPQDGITSHNTPTNLVNSCVLLTYTTAIDKWRHQSQHCIADYKADVIPVDLVVNGCILGPECEFFHLSRSEIENADLYGAELVQLLTARALLAATTAVDNHNTQTNLTKNDVISVDLVVNGYVLLACTTAIDQPKEIQVCNISESGLNPLTWGRAIDMGRKHVKDYPFSVCLWYPGGSCKSSWLQHQLALFFTHLLPAYFIDLILYLTGNKTFMVKIQKKVSMGLDVLQYYTTKEWDFKNDNFLALRKKVSKEDDEVFYTDIKQINWDLYIRDYIKGAREFCCKEPPATLPQARRLSRQLYYLDLVTKIMFAAFAVYFVFYYGKMLLSVM
uniref:Fatty acyl-CoA reductase n=1 Tax=Plutella xylostella TaxID=51655 RepID=A0A1L8D6G7_PLUXY